MEEIKRTPLLGDKFPEMTVNTTHGVKHLPGDYAGKWLVLFSHPGDFTPVCTTEFVGFSERADEFKALNAELMGLSVDQVFSHMKWAEWIEEHAEVKVPFPIIGDEMGITAQRLGMIHPGEGTSTVRAVYIVDDKGYIRLILFYPASAGRSIDEILRVLRALQVSDENGVAMPENWPNNKRLGDKVIIPPAENVEQAADYLERSKKGEFTYVDWWMCFKELPKK